MLEHRSTAHARAIWGCGVGRDLNVPPLCSMVAIQPFCGKAALLDAGDP
jgi:hypothetical protein